MRIVFHAGRGMHNDFAVPQTIQGLVNKLWIRDIQGILAHRFRQGRIYRATDADDLMPLLTKQVDDGAADVAAGSGYKDTHYRIP